MKKEVQKTRGLKSKSSKEGMTIVLLEDKLKRERERNLEPMKEDRRTVKGMPTSCNHLEGREDVYEAVISFGVG